MTNDYAPINNHLHAALTLAALLPIRSPHLEERLHDLIADLAFLTAAEKAQ